MINDQETVEIGKFQKPHGLRGELNAILDVDSDYVEERNPLIVSIDGINVPFYAESVRPKGNTSFLIKLEGVDDVEEASGFVNKLIFGLRKDLISYFDTPEEMVLDSDLEGYEVRDLQRGAVGTVEYLDDSTANTLLVVKDGSGNLIYIPFQDEFVEEIDASRRIIEINVPEGILDLNIRKI